MPGFCGRCYWGKAGAVSVHFSICWGGAVPGTGAIIAVGLPSMDSVFWLWCIHLCCSKPEDLMVSA